MRSQHLYEGCTSWKLSGEPEPAGGEPYLSEQVVLASCVAWGILGIEPWLTHLKIEPCLPAGLKGSVLNFTYLGNPLMVRVDGNTRFALRGSGTIRLMTRGLPGRTYVVTQDGRTIGKFPANNAGEFSFPAQLDSKSVGEFSCEPVE